jgi:hypothetical protein
VREDPVRKGLLFAGTENGVWVSLDDGDHWQSLQLNLPHTSMRDLWIHDTDLIVATHGRSFWILDDIAPLRELAAASPNAAHLFAPPPAYRIQRDTNTDTPLPPDEPAGTNPPDGAILDYYLPAAASSVSLEILDAKGKLVRRFTNTDKPDVTEEELQKQLIPLSWTRAPRQLAATTGMHRWTWDLHYPAPAAVRHEYPIAAIPHDTPRHPLGPTVLPGNYRVQLTVDGKSSTAPLSIKMDPRVKTSLAGLQKKFQAESRLTAIVDESSRAVLQAGSIRDQLDKLSAQADTGVRSAIEDAQKKLTALLGASRGPFAPPSQEPTLTRLNGAASSLYGEVWQADAEPTAAQLRALEATEHECTDMRKRWNEFKSSDLAALNRQLRQSKGQEITIEPDPHHEEPMSDEE